MYYLQRLTLLDVDSRSGQYSPIFSKAAKWLDASRKTLENKVLAGGIADFSYKQALEYGLNPEIIRSYFTPEVTQDELRTISHFLKRFNGRKLPLEPIASVEAPEINEAAIEYINQEETISKLVNAFLYTNRDGSNPTRRFQMSLTRRFNPDQVNSWIQAHQEPIGRNEWVDHLLKAKSFPDINESMLAIKARTEQREKEKLLRKEERQRIKYESKNKPLRPFNIDKFLAEHSQLVEQHQEAKLFKALYSKDVVVLAHRKIDELLPLENFRGTNVPELHKANVDLKTHFVEAALRANTHLKKVYGLEMSELSNSDQNRILNNCVFFVREDHVKSSTRLKLNELVASVRQLQDNSGQITRR